MSGKNLDFLDSGTGLMQCIDDIPRVKKCCFCIGIKAGTITIAIIGILFIFTNAVAIILQDTTDIYMSTLIVILLMAVFVFATVAFVVASFILLIGAVEEVQLHLSLYLFITIIYLLVQCGLCILMPGALILDGVNAYKALTWGVVTMIVALIWTHFLAVVGTYRRKLSTVCHP